MKILKIKLKIIIKLEKNIEIFLKMVLKFDNLNFLFFYLILIQIHFDLSVFMKYCF